jgi:hypothetical protein
MKRKNYGQLLIPLEGLEDDDFRAARDVALDRVEQAAGNAFVEAACAIVLEHLTLNGPTTAEALTNECKRRGAVPHDDRAFGPVYRRLLGRRQIEPCGTAIRTKGHGTAGGRIWKLTSQ